MNLNMPSSLLHKRQAKIDSSNSNPFTKIDMEVTQSLTEIIESHIPFNEALEETPSISFGVLKKAILIDVSINKEWIAYITEEPIDQNSGNQLPSTKNVLSISRFIDTSKGILEASFPTALATLKLNKKMFEDADYSGYFISVSPGGSRIAMSFMKLNDEGGVEDVPNSRNPYCLIFKVSNDDNTYGNKYITMEKRQLKFQGRAMFLDDNNLALINEKVVKVYDLNESYKEKYWVDLTSLSMETVIQRIPFEDNAIDASWAYLYHSDPKAELVKDNAFNRVVYMSMFATQYILTTYWENVARIWSIKEDGMRLTSLCESFQQIVIGISPDTRFVARLSYDTGNICIYHTKTGLLINTLAQNKKGLDKKSRKSCYAQFCCNNYYVVCINIWTLPDTRQMRISFEIWNVNAGKLVLQKEIITYDILNRNYKLIEPHVIIKQTDSHIPEFLILYSTLSSNGSCEIKSVDLNNNVPYPIPTGNIEQQEDSNTEKQELSKVEQHGNSSLKNQKDNSTGEQEINDNKQRETSNTTQQDGFNISWKTVNVSLNNETEYFFYEKFQVENELNDFKELTCFRMNYYDGIYLLRFGTHTVQLWRLSTPSTDEQLIYIRAYKPASEAFTQDYDPKWTLNKGWKRDEKKVFEEALRPDQNGRVEVHICSEIFLDDNYEKTEPISNKYYFDEVYLPLEELLQSEDNYRFSMDKTKDIKLKTVKIQSKASNIKGKPSVSSTNEESNHTTERDVSVQKSPLPATPVPSFKFQCVEYHYIESACQALHYIWTYLQTKFILNNTV